VRAARGRRGREAGMRQGGLKVENNRRQERNNAFFEIKTDFRANSFLEANKQKRLQRSQSQDQFLGMYNVRLSNDFLSNGMFRLKLT
jgi:hypothetical protein